MSPLKSLYYYPQIIIQLVPVTTRVVHSNIAHAEVYSIQHYAIQFVSDLWHVGGFLRVLRVPAPIKLTVTIVEIGVKHHNLATCIIQIALLFNISSEQNTLIQYYHVFVLIWSLLS
jgi:hypothetical protein